MNKPPIKNPTTLLKVVRNGQITIPKALRDQLKISEGDLLEAKLSNGQMIIKPKSAIDSELARNKFFKMAEEIRANAKDIEPATLESIIRDAVVAAKRYSSKNKQKK